MSRRFIIQSQDIHDGTVALNKEESRHAIKVLKLKVGEVAELLDGNGGKYRGIVSSIRDGVLNFAIDQSLEVISSNGKSAKNILEITLAAAVIKPEAMDLLIQKSCELGVNTLQPLLTERSVVHLNAERWAAKQKRWQKISESSCKQCGQTRIPSVGVVQNFEKYLNANKNYFDLILLPTLAVKGTRLVDALEASKATRALVLIGPEGDFSAKEVKIALESGAKAVTLGSLVLRSETAAVYLLSALKFYFDEVVTMR